jgi:hypothetical protein
MYVCVCVCVCGYNRVYINTKTGNRQPASGSQLLVYFQSGTKLVF